MAFSDIDNLDDEFFGMSETLPPTAVTQDRARMSSPAHPQYFHHNPTPGLRSSRGSMALFDSHNFNQNYLRYIDPAENVGAAPEADDFLIEDLAGDLGLRRSPQEQPFSIAEDEMSPSAADSSGLFTTATDSQDSNLSQDIMSGFEFYDHAMPTPATISQYTRGSRVPLGSIDSNVMKPTTIDGFNNGLPFPIASQAYGGSEFANLAPVAPMFGVDHAAQFLDNPFSLGQEVVAGPSKAASEAATETASEADADVEADVMDSRGDSPYEDEEERRNNGDEQADRRTASRSVTPPEHNQDDGAAQSSQEDEDIKLHFGSSEHAAAACKGPDWKPVSPDPTVPKDDEERKAIVKRLFKAMLNRENNRDKTDGPVYISRWGQKNGDGSFKPYYALEHMEKVCWDILNAAIEIHTNGPGFITTYDPECRKQIDKTKKYTFEERIEYILDVLYFYKARCDKFMRGGDLLMYVAAPKEILDTSKTNRSMNTTRQELLTTGRRVASQGDIVEGEDNVTPSAGAGRKKATAKGAKGAKRTKKPPKELNSGDTAQANAVTPTVTAAPTVTAPPQNTAPRGKKRKGGATETDEDTYVPASRGGNKKRKDDVNESDDDAYVPGPRAGKRARVTMAPVTDAITDVPSGEQSGAQHRRRTRTRTRVRNN